jgi:hypothetical protein
VSSGPELDIRITTRGVVGTSAGGEGTAEAAPAPDADMGGADDARGGLVGGLVDGAPAPLAALGSAAAEEALPSPEALGSIGAEMGGGDMPTPVPLEEIEQLGAATAADEGTPDLPVPDDEH